uniref:site-specific DNA-methyltransferase (adenine-specific) n=1 Tax=Schlesneria paludicola TaxID=360056 RepID=A0A7C2NXG8_9PLAN
MSSLETTQQLLFDREVLPAIADRERRSQLGQFFTPSVVADFMASLFEPLPREIRLLDAGAGAGSLTEAFVQHCCRSPKPPDAISVAAFEVDEWALDQLQSTLQRCQRACREAGIEFSPVINEQDFIAAASDATRNLFSPQMQFDAAIVNPPYRKINSSSRERRLLRGVGIETSNLYSAFIALIVRLLAPGGQLVAITPRSFCNGPYFRPFRTDFLSRMSLRRMHVFDSRSAAFASDAVLQENVVFHAVKGREPPANVVISSSAGTPGSVISARGVPFSEMVHPHDPERFIHLETDDAHRQARNLMCALPASLASLGVMVSTGRVVDFRAREHLRAEAEPGCVPLLYPCHFVQGVVSWPKSGSRKPNAILDTSATRDLLVPSGHYVLVKRFSAKEEKRRIVAAVCNPEQIPGAVWGIENHLNYFHVNGLGLDRELASGLSAFLNSTIVDQYFRQFSGHTQVNSTDLRSFRYPAAASLRRLGSLLSASLPSQPELDELVLRELF